MDLVTTIFYDLRKKETVTCPDKLMLFNEGDIMTETIR